MKNNHMDSVLSSLALETPSSKLRSPRYGLSRTVESQEPEYEAPKLTNPDPLPSLLESHHSQLPLPALVTNQEFFDILRWLRPGVCWHEYRIVSFIGIGLTGATVRASHLVIEQRSHAEQGAIETCAFMAPELWRGGPRSAVSDVFSAASLLRYFLLARYDSSRYRHSDIRSDLHCGWDPILGKAMRTKAARRFPSAMEFEECLNLIEVPKGF